MWKELHPRLHIIISNDENCVLCLCWGAAAAQTTSYLTFSESMNTMQSSLRLERKRARRAP